MRFAHRLVLAGVGGQTVGELNQRMTVDEFMRWQAFFELEPFGQEDVWFALLRRTLTAINTPKGSRVPTLDKFMLADNDVSNPHNMKEETKARWLEAGGTEEEWQAINGD